MYTKLLSRLSRAFPLHLHLFDYTGRESCERVAYDGGYVGSIKDSCKGKGESSIELRTCFYAGAFGGFIGSIKNSCFLREACRKAAVGGYVGSIQDSCKGEEACYGVAYYGDINFINKSCFGDYACYYAAYNGGSINGINKACLGDYACYRAAYNGGSINGAGISKACLTPSSCYGVAYLFSYALESEPEISSGITNCVCDTCAGVLDDASLPDECGDKLDFVGDLLDELEDIIKSKIGN